MIFIWGFKFCGKTDEVPGFFHVSTRFFHFWYFPLIPVGTHLVLEEGREEPVSMEIPFSFKSLLLGWSRTGTLMLGIISGIIALATMGKGDSWGAVATSASSFVAFFLLTFGQAFRRASYERAAQLGEIIGLNNQGKVMIDLHFAKMDEAEAERFLQDAEVEDIAEEEEALARRKEALVRRKSSASFTDDEET